MSGRDQAITPDVQKRLYHETDLRFWTKTGYHPGKPLNPADKIDATMIPTWQTIYGSVADQYKRGALVWTSDSPAMQNAVANASTLSSAAAGSMADALHTLATAPEASALHVQTGAAAQQAAAAAAKGAATTHGTPLEVSPDSLQQAANMVSSIMPASAEDVVKIMQAQQAPQHAAEVAAANGLAFTMDGSGRGVRSSSSAQQPADLPGAAVPTASPPGGGAPVSHEPHHYKIAPAYMPLVVLGSVAAAVGLGSLVMKAGSGGSGRRRSRGGGAGKHVVAVTKRYR